MADTSDQKLKFAKALLEKEDPFQAALTLFSEDDNKAVNKATRIAIEWPNDVEVKSAIRKIKESVEGLELLPTKVDLALNVWHRMQPVEDISGRKIHPAADDYAKLAKLYAEVMGFIEKPQTNINTNVFTQRVIETPVYASTDDWEKEASRQQRDLLDASRTRH